ncbi:PucR family transcriptional regulator [Jatrophihabitans fulvus]
MGSTGIGDATIRAVEQAIGRLATQSVARMDEELPWFRELPSDQRSWVTLVAQSGLQSFVAWLRNPDDVLQLTGGVFSAAPNAMARTVTLQQTVELVRTAITVAEQNLPGMAAEHEVAPLREELLRFSREIAFAAARVYATAAENRGSWDRRLEALVIDALVSGTGDPVGGALSSRLAALGWRSTGPIFAIVGSAPGGPADLILTAAHARTRRLGADLMAGLHADRLVVVVGGLGSSEADVEAVAKQLLPAFGPGPVVIGPAAPDVAHAADVTQTALRGLAAVPGWPDAPRPVHADALLPERTLAGDEQARRQLVSEVHDPLVAAGGSLVETVTTFLECGGGLEATARALFVHANTVRYRLRRVAEVCGWSPTDARGAFTLQIALVVGRLEAGRGNTDVN